MKQKDITAIMDDQVESLLQYTGQYEKLINGELTCMHCGRIITSENIGIIIPRKINGQYILSFICDDTNCCTKD